MTQVMAPSGVTQHRAQQQPELDICVAFGGSTAANRRRSGIEPIASFSSTQPELQADALPIHQDPLVMTTRHHSLPCRQDHWHVAAS